MRYLVAGLGSVFMFVAVWLLCGLALTWLTPPARGQTEVYLGFFGGNVVSIIATLAGAAAAGHTFRASLKVKAGRRHKSPEEPRIMAEDQGSSRAKL